MPEFIPGTRVPASRVVSGPPGESWVNDTGKVLYQLRVNWVNSCGTCIQRSNLIGPWWPTPFHVSCMCRNIPIFPGQTARPFHDFLDEIAGLPDGQRKKVVGAGNYRLIEAGLADWTDVVTAARVRTLAEVLARVRPTDAQLGRLGIRRPPAVTPAPQPTRAVGALDRLRAAGLSDGEIRRRLAERVARRFGITRTAPAPSVGVRLGLRASP